MNTQGKTTSKSTSDQAAPNEPVQPKIVLKEQIKVRMDRFKLLVAAMRKNLSWKPRQPQIVDVEHVHFFITTDENGRAQEFSTPVGGHFHKVTWAVDPTTGDLRASCGPALRYIHKTMANGKQKKILANVEFRAQKETVDGVEDYLIKDTHTHECVYMHSQYMNAEEKREIQKQNSAAIGPVQTKPVSAAAATGQIPAGFSLEGSKLD